MEAFTTSAPGRLRRIEIPTASLPAFRRYQIFEQATWTQFGTTENAVCSFCGTCTRVQHVRSLSRPAIILVTDAGSCICIESERTPFGSTRTTRSFNCKLYYRSFILLRYHI